MSGQKPGYGDIIRKAKETETQQVSEPVKPKADMSETQLEPSQPKEKDVNLTIAVPLSLRQHWVGEAKKRGLTIKDIVTEALIAKFGKP
ncbi:hypothetical protein [Nostoc sp.]|uniref:hypothetical protein n=1 Tax=Nostoc sp. TaxID=1180 RepID=UPI002FF3A977